MFEFLGYSLGRLEDVELAKTEAAIRDHVTKRDKLKKASFTMSNASPIYRVEIPPCTPVWPDVWKSDKGIPIDRNLQIPFSIEKFASLLPLVQSHPEKLEVSVTILWPRHGAFHFQLPLESIHERRYIGYRLGINPHPRNRHADLFKMLKCMFGGVSKLWAVEDNFNITSTKCNFLNKFTDTRNGRISCSNGMRTPDWASTMSYFNIEDFQFASQLAEETAKVLVDCMGKPKCIEVKVASFVEEAASAAEFCQTLAPKWYTGFHPNPNKKFDPFKHPGHSEGTLIYPVAWNENRANEIDMEDLMDIYTAVEHHPDGSRLLLATNHDDAWLKKTVTEVGYGDQFELLGDETKYADSKALVKNIKALAKVNS
ncbi:hypothetical protein [Novipirellula caenicola]|uniref:Uncharacterized protein n=1 Tax=Novipirellula caenicola TaxID=1536901 RepID=A0ABP9VZN7_9BACT